MYITAVNTLNITLLGTSRQNWCIGLHQAVMMCVSVVMYNKVFILILPSVLQTLTKQKLRRTTIPHPHIGQHVHAILTIDIHDWKKPSVMLFNKNRWLLMFRLQLHTSVTMLISKKSQIQKIASKVMLGFPFDFICPDQHNILEYCMFVCDVHKAVNISQFCIHPFAIYDWITATYKKTIYSSMTINLSTNLMKPMCPLLSIILTSPPHILMQI